MNSVIRLAIFFLLVSILTIISIYISMNKAEYMQEHKTPELLQKKLIMRGWQLKPLIFKTFLRNLLDVLVKEFPKSKLPKFNRILAICLVGLNYNYTKRFGRYVKMLSRMDGEEIRQLYEDYKKDLYQPLPRRRKFFEAIEKAFTLKDVAGLQNYTYMLRDFGTGNINNTLLEEKTQLMLQIIIDSIQKRLNKHDQAELLQKLKDALSEYELKNFDFHAIYKILRAELARKTTVYPPISNDIFFK